MPSTQFEQLDVYRLSEQLADEIWRIVLRWPNLARDTVGKQMIRSADGIGANIAEGVGRGTYLDNKRFVHMARGSLYETKHWLRRSWARKLLSPAQVRSLKPVVDELSPRLNAYLKSIERRCGKGKAGSHN